jgi:hypothetical protein
MLQGGSFQCENPAILTHFEQKIDKKADFLSNRRFFIQFMGFLTA